MVTTMKARSSWLQQDDLRLDASFYGSDGQKEARFFIDSIIKKKELQELTQNNEEGIFIPSRFKRVYVDNNNVGYPYLTGSIIVQSDPLKNCNYLSRKYTKNIDRLSLNSRDIIVTCSGNIGKTVLISDYFIGSIGSPDLLRIVPDSTKILPGYLYAYLSSKIGKALLTQKTYGSVIQHIEAHHIKDILVPILNKKLMQKVHDLIEESSQLKQEANQILIELNESVNKILDINENYQVHGYSTVRIKSSSIDNKLGALYHSRWKIETINKIKKNKNYKYLEEVTSKVFAPPMFKHIYLDKDNGYPFIVGGELSQFDNLTTHRRYLSKIGVKNIEDYVVKEKWTLLYRHGQLNSMLGDVFYVSKGLENFCMSDLIIRIIPKDIDDGYLNSILRSKFYSSLLKTLATGNMIPFLSENAIRKIPIPIINQNEQKRIGDKLRSAFNKKDKARQKTIKAITLLEKELSKWLD